MDNFWTNVFLLALPFPNRYTGWNSTDFPLFYICMLSSTSSSTFSSSTFSSFVYFGFLFAGEYSWSRYFCILVSRLCLSRFKAILVFLFWSYTRFYLSLLFGVNISSLTSVWSLNRFSYSDSQLFSSSLLFCLLSFWNHWLFLSLRRVMSISLVSSILVRDLLENITSAYSLIIANPSGILSKNSLYLCSPFISL